MSLSTTHADADATGIDPDAVRRGRSIKSVYVYEAPVRLWHWVNALAIVVLAVTGYFIGQPLPSVMGEASDHFMMGYIRFAHFAAGYIFAIGLLGRLYWAFVGNHHARELFMLPVFKAAYWREFWAMLRWYLFLSPRPNQYVGHNPVARFAMFFGFLLATGALHGLGLAIGQRLLGWRALAWQGLGAAVGAAGLALLALA